MACYVCKRFMSSVGVDSNGLQNTKKVLILQDILRFWWMIFKCDFIYDFFQEMQF